MMRLFFLRRKEEEIKAIQEQFHKDIDKDILRVRKINAVLGNGITLKISKATGGHHGH